MVATVLAVSWLTKTRMTSLFWQFVRVTVIVAVVELPVAKQSSPFTKFAVMAPPALTVAVTGFEVAEGEKVIDAELEVQIMKVKPVFGVAVRETVEP